MKTTEHPSEPAPAGVTAADGEAEGRGNRPNLRAAAAAAFALGFLAAAGAASLAAGPAPTIESLQKEISTLKAQNTICSADLSRVMQDRVLLVESLANSNAELEKTKAALATATSKAGAVSTPTVAPPSEPPKGARR